MADINLVPAKRERLAPVDHLDKPTFEPLGESPFTGFMGVEIELEVDKPSYKYRDEIIFECDKILNPGRPKFCIFKIDGSLEYGFEICTRPTTFEIQKQKWKEFFKQLPNGITCSDRCGIHIHLSKNNMSVLQIGKILQFIHREPNREFIELIAGRGSKLHSNFALHQKITHSLKKYLNNFKHYSPVNLLNKDSVEIRIFAGSKDLNIVLKNLEFCHALVNFTLPAQTNIQKSGEVDEFLSFVKRSRLLYPNLVKFLVVKNRLEVSSLDQSYKFVSKI